MSRHVPSWHDSGTDFCTAARLRTELSYSNERREPRAELPRRELHLDANGLELPRDNLAGADPVRPAAHDVEFVAQRLPVGHAAHGMMVPVANGGAGGQQVGDLLGVAPGGGTGLPAGWEAFVSPEGREYFHHAASKETQWAHPLEEYYRSLVFMRKEGGEILEKNNEVACLCSLNGLASDRGWLPASPEPPKIHSGCGGPRTPTCEPRSAGPKKSAGTPPRRLGRR